MATLAGTHLEVPALLQGLLDFNREVTLAYEEALRLLGQAPLRPCLLRFFEQHREQERRITALAGRLGAPLPGPSPGRDYTVRAARVRAAEGPQVDLLRALAGDEADAQTAYDQAVQNHALDPAARQLLLDFLSMEQRHHDWLCDRVQELALGHAPFLTLESCP